MSYWYRFPAAVATFAFAVAWGWCVFLATRSTQRASRAVTAIMAGPICRVLLLDVRLHGTERLSGVGPSVIVANHQSLACHQVLAHVHRLLVDPVVVGKLTGKWGLPLMSDLFRITGNVVVREGDPTRNAQALRQARAALARGATVGIYPEGTRRKDTRVLGDFQPGAFALAISAGVPVIPIVISRFSPRFDLGARHVEPHVAHVRVLEPVSTEGLTRADLATLRDEVRARMQRVLDADEAHGPGPA